VVLKTLHITNAWHPSSGGIGTFYKALLTGANEIGWEMRLVVPSAEDGYEPVGKFGGIHHVRAPRAPIHPEYRVLYPHTYLLPRGPLLKILRAEQPHVVEVNDKYTLPYLAGLLRIGMIAGLQRRPAVVGISCERMDRTLNAYSNWQRTAVLFARAFMKCVYFTQFDHHIAVSRDVAGELESAARGHKVTRGVWIRGMGVDVERFTPQRRLPHEIPVDHARLLYAGRLAPEKNLGLLLDMLEHLPRNSCQLLIAGDGPSRQEFLDAANARFPGTIVYLGHERDRVALANLFANTDAFLHPNPREPFGIAPLEAMAAGTPLVAPNSGGVTSYAHQGNAWLSEPTGQAFAQSVHDILQNPHKRALRTAAARETALRFGWPAVCEDFHALYQDLYARTLGAPTRLEPAFYSTPGNWLGMEIDPTTSLSNSGSRSR
jgi:alpha-1,6-mannosyltransferase